MERPELKLVTGPPARSRTKAAAFAGAAVLAAAALATMRGADAARAPFDAAALAESALAASLASHDDAPAREAEGRLRERLVRTPLDAASRTILASLLVETADSRVERDLAAGQAQAATRLVASDERIAHGTARVLARCGRPELALREVARIFDYAPDAGAVALADIEPFAPAGRLEEGLPPSPAAWLAWSERLEMNGRQDEADARLARLLDRWPGDLDALRVAAGAAASRDRDDELVRLVPPSLALPDTETTAALHAYRARSKALTGDATGARADALHATALAPGNPWVLALAGDALAASDKTLARELWNRALYRLLASAETRDGARWVRARIARLDEREGRAGDALRGWRTILAEHADDAEARRRVAELTGESPR